MFDITVFLDVVASASKFAFQCILVWKSRHENMDHIILQNERCMLHVYDTCSEKYLMSTTSSAYNDNSDGNADITSTAFSADNGDSDGNADIMSTVSSADRGNSVFWPVQKKWPKEKHGEVVVQRGHRMFDIPQIMSSPTTDQQRGQGHSQELLLNKPPTQDRALTTHRQILGTQQQAHILKLRQRLCGYRHNDVTVQKRNF
jgi:hypothetical protein